MPELLAHGPQPNETWTYPILPRPIKLGRKSPESDSNCPWDARISRFHATLSWREGKLRVERNPNATNPIYYRGQVTDDFEIAAGEQFVIGGTTFTLQERASVNTQPDSVPPTGLMCGRQELQEPVPVKARADLMALTELRCSRQEQVPYTETPARIKVLATLQTMINKSSSEEELERQVLVAILRGIPRADIAAVVWLNPA